MHDHTNEAVWINPKNQTFSQRSPTGDDGRCMRAVFEDFTGPALATGQVVPAPAPMVSGHSLESIPDALALLRRGVSAAKVVISR